MVRILLKNCAVCGKELTIVVYPNGEYKGGHYFGKVRQGDMEIEYWECDECYNRDDITDTL